MACSDSRVSMTDVADDLARCPLFEGLSSREDLERCCPTATRLDFHDKETIYFQGEPCLDVFCVLEGQVKLARVSGEGTGFTIALLSGGELFGSALSGAAGTEAQEAATARGATVVW
ncbi:MAG: cyclic nucleotide-binding domain-containing protein, partial [Vicinamibacteria bacterium]|nr:cyclic nucleotide-binding domain-containing protein [Vicinamibacteria bacterium]